jgi:hypothetical protein
MWRRSCLAIASISFTEAEDEKTSALLLPAEATDNGFTESGDDINTPSISAI